MICDIFVPEEMVFRVPVLCVVRGGCSPRCFCFVSLVVGGEEFFFCENYPVFSPVLKELDIARGEVLPSSSEELVFCTLIQVKVCFLDRGTGRPCKIQDITTFNKCVFYVLQTNWYWWRRLYLTMYLRNVHLHVTLHACS